MRQPARLRILAGFIFVNFFEKGLEKEERSFYNIINYKTLLFNSTFSTKLTPFLNLLILLKNCIHYYSIADDENFKDNDIKRSSCNFNRSDSFETIPYGGLAFREDRSRRLYDGRSKGCP